MDGQIGERKVEWIYGDMFNPLPNFFIFSAEFHHSQ